MIQRLGSSLVKHGDSTLSQLLTTMIPLVGNIMVNVRDYGAKCDGVTDDSDAVQAAVNANKTLVFPADKSIYLSKKITLQRDSILIGFNTKLIGATGISILEFPRFNGVITGTTISGFHFIGDNCVGIAVSAAGLGDGQGYYRYVPRLSIKECHFYGELLYGITANLIFTHVSHCSFGYLITAGKTKIIKGIRSHYTQTEPNRTNFNLVEFSYFYGSPDAINARGGSSWVVRMCDFEQGGQCITFDNINLLTIEDCWMESCTGTEGVIKITNCASNAIVTRNMLYRAAGADGGVISYDGNTVKNLVVTHNYGELQGQSPLFNTPLAGTSAAIRVPPTNNVIYHDNQFDGTIQSNSAYQNSYNYRGEGSTRAFARLNFAAGTVTSSSVPVTMSKQAVGSYILTFPNNLGVTAITALAVSITAYDGYCRFAATANANEVLVNTYKGDTHALFDSQDVSVTLV